MCPSDFGGEEPMGTNDAELHKNEEELGKELGSEAISQLKDLGLGVILGYIVGAGAGVIVAVISLVRSQVHKMRLMAQESIRRRYSDDRILVMGQQVAGEFSSEDCWAYVNRVGGTMWVQNINVTRGEALAFVVLWHPDSDFKLRKDIIRVYRSRGSQCFIDDSVPTFRAAS
jgi:hypothetical protein